MWHKQQSEYRDLDVANLSSDFPGLKAFFPVTEAAGSATLGEVISGGTIAASNFTAGPDDYSKYVGIVANTALSGFTWPSFAGKVTGLLGVFDDAGTTGFTVGHTINGTTVLRIETSNACSYLDGSGDSASRTFTYTGARVARMMLINALTNQLSAVEYNGTSFNPIAATAITGSTGPLYAAPEAVCSRNQIGTTEDYLYQLWQFPALPSNGFLQAMLTWAYDNAIRGYKAPYPGLKNVS